MTLANVWIGELASGDDPLDWGGAWNIGNTPAKRVSPHFPPLARGAYEPFSTVVRYIKAGVLEGRQVDWGAWGAVVTPQEVSKLIDELYGTDRAYCNLEHLCAELARLRGIVQMLPEHGRFALVAAEV